MLHKFTFENGQVRYISRHTAEGVIRRAKKDGFLSVTMFGLNANTPLKDAQDPCSALLGAQVSLESIIERCESNTKILGKQSLWLPSGYLEPDAANVNVVPRRGMHLPKDENPLSRGTASEKPEEEEACVPLYLYLDHRTDVNK